MIHTLKSNQKITLAIIPLILSITLSGALPFVNSNHLNEAFAQQSMVITPKSLIHIYDNAYLLIFQACTGSESITPDEIKIVSDIETFSLVNKAEEDREITAQECRPLEVQIRADDVYSIKIEVERFGISVPVNPDEVNREAVSYQRVETDMRAPIEISIRTSDLAHSDMPLTEKQLQECEQSHNDFVSLPSDQFAARNVYHSFMGDCVILFEDPVWDAEGEDRYEMLSQRLAEIKQKLMEQEALLEKPITLRKLSVIETGTEGLYIFTFEGCSGQHSVNVDNAVVVSDVEVFSLVSEKREGNIIPPGFCRVIDIQIKADDPNSIRVMIPSLTMEKEMGEMKKGPHMSPRAQMKQGVPADDVVCKEGLQLMKKSRDGSPACVSERAVSKLVERGWGAPI